jgi:hypothetical protein
MRMAAWLPQFAENDVFLPIISIRAQLFPKLNLQFMKNNHNCQVIARSQQRFCQQMVQMKPDIFETENLGNNIIHCMFFISRKDAKPRRAKWHINNLL